ncbi:hypothetical protein BGX38DRAFT_566718 [Terfezia claveryi]|nr:hypothetical protein BGX38DRAFT_566718 [Terfezia claveryi]
MHSEFVRCLIGSKMERCSCLQPCSKTHYTLSLRRSDLTWAFSRFVFSYPDVCMFPLLFLVSCRVSILGANKSLIQANFPSVCWVGGFNKRQHNIRCSHNPSVGRFRRIYHPHSLDRIVLCLNTRYLLYLTYQRGSFLYPSTGTICPNYLLYMLPTHALEFRL